MSIVADYSAGFPGAQALKEAGFIGAVRYIGSPGNIKCATKDELKDFTAWGLGMALVFEQTAGQWRNGYNQGVRDAQTARAHADSIGFPRSRPIYFAIDQDVVTSAEFDAMDAYADGWAAVLGYELCGPYGEYDVVARCYARGFRWAWQCRAWSGTPVRYFEPRHLFQRVGTVTVNRVPCDINDVSRQDWGQHSGGEEMASWDDELEDWEVRPGETKKQRATARVWLIAARQAAGVAEANSEKALSEVRSVREVVEQLQTSGVPTSLTLSEKDKRDIAAYIVELQEQRARDGDPETGPVS